MPSTPTPCPSTLQVTVHWFYLRLFRSPAYPLETNIGMKAFVRLL